MRVGVAWCSCLLAVACARENPEFGLGEGATEGAASGGTVAESGRTTGMVDPTAPDDDDDDATEPDDDDDDSTEPDDDDDDDDDDNEPPIDTGGEETDGGCDADLDVLVPVWEDTFVVSDPTGTCGGGSCEVANFGASATWPVLDNGAGAPYRAYMLARFDIAGEQIAAFESVDIVVHVSNDQPQYMPFELAVFSLANKDWGEGSGVEQLAIKGEASWVAAAVPTPWADDASNFEDAVGFLLGEAAFGATDGGTELAITLDPAEIDGLVDTDGYLSVAVTVTDGQPTSLWTREAMALATALHVIGCSE